ncbi:hypothetical protein SLEP1_g26133 [Rubroshorea leprosula]|uniref:Uncharacterized protein n=1 Tax=Rubroshorea leprosula TaxID=152421 RepID=A0AAV5JT75_9ROSI|nr:hypothetical protein SLEP1_g26133 [Rubroshorea leprosula]
MARSYSHRHTGGVCSVQGTCHVVSWSASADMRIGASTIMGASGRVDAGMWDAGVDVATRGCDYGTIHSRTQAQGGSLETQWALPAEASILGPWHEVADRTCMSMQKQSGATCVGARECPRPRHGCTHGPPGSRCWHAWGRTGSRHWHARERPGVSIERVMCAAEEVSTREKYTWIWCRYLCSGLEQTRTL